MTGHKAPSPNQSFSSLARAQSRALLLKQQQPDRNQTCIARVDITKGCVDSSKEDRLENHCDNTSEPLRRSRFTVHDDGTDIMQDHGDNDAHRYLHQQVEGSSTPCQPGLHPQFRRRFYRGRIDRPHADSSEANKMLSRGDSPVQAEQRRSCGDCMQSSPPQTRLWSSTRTLAHGHRDEHGPQTASSSRIITPPSPPTPAFAARSAADEVAKFTDELFALRNSVDTMRDSLFAMLDTLEGGLLVGITLAWILLPLAMLAVLSKLG